jgi:hypothetical protein
MNDKMVDREIRQIENEIKGDMFMTEIRKKKFIGDLKSGLGEEIKKNPNQVKFIKEPWYKKVSNFIKKIFRTL